MIIYNITTHVEEEIRETWLTWMNEVHIPEILACGKFKEARFCKVLVDDAGGSTYSLQFICESREILESYYAEDAPELRQKSHNRFGEKAIAFRTELQLLSQH